MSKDALQRGCPDDTWAALKRMAKAENDALLECDKLRAALDAAERLLKLIRHWANSKCPCENETPDPCPLCGSSVAEGRCKALEETLPRNIADPMSDFLARDKGRP